MRTRSRKRSSCASGSGKVPSSSTGFWVARTRKGLGSGRLSPSAVTCFSSIASNRADWVRGVARLISSARRTCVKTGPGRKENSAVRWSKTWEPVMSEGSRSGVNCTRRKVQPRERAMVRASMVLPMPGTSSIRTCPLQRMATRSSSVASRLPTMTRSTWACRRWAAAAIGPIAVEIASTLDPGNVVTAGVYLSSSVCAAVRNLNSSDSESRTTVSPWVRSFWYASRLRRKE